MRTRRQGRRPTRATPTESQLVAEDDRRLFEVRTIGALAKLERARLEGPYRLVAGRRYTLVLTPRREPYTISDLLELAPQTFVRQPDGSYLLSEHLVVQAGATLNLTGRAPGAAARQRHRGLRVHRQLRRSPGRSAAPRTTAVHITSWDRGKGGPDDSPTTAAPTCGRSAARWPSASTRLPAPRLLERPDRRPVADRDGPAEHRPAGRPGPVHEGRHHAAKRVIRAKEQEKTALRRRGNPAESSSRSCPRGPAAPDREATTPMYSYVSASITTSPSTATPSACSSPAPTASTSATATFSDNLVDGLVLHRYVVNAVVERHRRATTRGDGVVLARATTGIVLSEVTATGTAATA